MESHSTTKIIAGLFGENMNFSKLKEFILSLVFKNPDDYYKVKDKKFLEVISEQFNLTKNVTNWSNLKWEMQSIFEKLNNSNEKPFYFILNFMWFSSLPCFDVQNMTAGNTETEPIYSERQQGEKQYIYFLYIIAVKKKYV
jgi:hypothetical protein